MNHSKKVLFIDYFFPPLAADWRGIAFVRLLPEFGWQPIVLSAAESVSYDKDYSLLQEIPRHTRVQRVAHRESARLWRYIRTRLRIAADFPDSYRTWFAPAYREAKRILRSERIDLIYTASPSFTTAFVAMRLRKEFNVPWVADFLDGWAVNDFLNAEYDQILMQPLRWIQKNRVRKAESRILRLADKVTVIHPHVKERWCALYGIEAGKVEVITDGYDESAFRGITARSLYPDRLTIVFLGSYYAAFREPVMQFLDVVSEIASDAEVVFIGRAAAAVHQMNRSNVTCVLNLPREKALSFALGSDFLFVVMPSYARWTPTKTYDYLRLGKPILALVPEDGDAARIVNEAKAGFVLPFEQEAMKWQLDGIFKKWRRGEFKGFRPNQEYIAQFERRNVAERMARVFEEVSQ